MTINFDADPPLVELEFSEFAELLSRAGDEPPRTPNGKLMTGPRLEIN